MDLLPKPRLDVRDLEVLLALAQSGSTTRAAAALHLTQSAVSRALNLAEEKFGTPLFERTARGLTPTAVGERLIAGAGPILSQWVEIERRAEMPVNETTRIRVVCECYTAYRWFPSALQRLARTARDLDVVLAPEHTNAPVAALQDDLVDVALLTTSKVGGAIFDEPLFSDEIVFVMARSHPLARRATLAWRDLVLHRLIASSSTPRPEARWFLSKVFGKRKPKIDWIRFPLTEAIVDAARAGMGVAVMSEWIAGPYVEREDLVVKRLDTGPLRRPWRLAYRRENRESARRFAGAMAGAPPKIYVAASHRGGPLDPG